MTATGEIDALCLTGRHDVRYEKDRRADECHRVGQMDLLIEGLKQEDLELRR